MRIKKLLVDSIKYLNLTFEINARQSERFVNTVAWPNDFNVLERLKKIVNIVGREFIFSTDLANNPNLI